MNDQGSENLPVTGDSGVATQPSRSTVGRQEISDAHCLDIIGSQRLGEIAEVLATKANGKERVNLLAKNFGMILVREWNMAEPVDDLETGYRITEDGNNMLGVLERTLQELNSYRHQSNFIEPIKKFGDIQDVEERKRAVGLYFVLRTLANRYPALDGADKLNGNIQHLFNNSDLKGVAFGSEPKEEQVGKMVEWISDFTAKVNGKSGTSEVLPGV